MKIAVKPFRVHEGEKVDLDTRPTEVDPLYESKEDYKTILAKHIHELSAMQRLLYAANSDSVLIIFQAMDAAGKDGAIKHVMSGVNPQGCQVYSFQHPSATELRHDFLWRTTCVLPERGRIGIFNRSYYEEVLIARVHPEILEAEGITRPHHSEKDIWRERYRSINDFERHIDSNRTKVIKFFLHLSKEEQKKRFIKRIEDPHKNWKLSADDIKERDYWKDYMKAYEACLSATSSDFAPWHIVPADDKKNARLIVSQTILDTMEKLDLSYPKTGKSHQQELDRIHKLLLNE